MKKLTLTIDVSIEKEFSDEVEDLKSELIGEMVKVKSGYYENRMIGWITDIKID